MGFVLSQYLFSKIQYILCKWLLMIQGNSLKTVKSVLRRESSDNNGTNVFLILQEKSKNLGAQPLGNDLKV